MSSANSNNLTSFPIQSPLFLCLSWLLWLMFWILYWTRVVRVDILVLLLILQGKFLIFSPFIWCCQYVCHLWLLSGWGKGLLYLFSSGIFHEWMSNFVKGYFLVPIEMIVWFLSLCVFMLCTEFIYLWVLNSFSIPMMQPTWSWCMLFLMICLWNLEDFCIYIC